MSEENDKLLTEIRDLLRESNERGKRIEESTLKRVDGLRRWPALIFIAFAVYLLFSLLK